MFFSTIFSLYHTNYYGTKLEKYYDEIKRIGGLTAQIRLAIITKIPRTKVTTAEDSDANVAIFEAAVQAIKKNLNTVKINVNG
jgi:hypothetical protein